MFKAYYFSDQKSDTSNDSELDLLSSKKPLANINDKYQSADSSVKSSDIEKDITSHRKTTGEKEDKLSETSQKSIDKKKEPILPKETEIKEDVQIDSYFAESTTDQEKIETQSNEETEAEPKAIETESRVKPKQDADEPFQTDVDFKIEQFKDDIDIKSTKTGEENEDEFKDKQADTDNIAASINEEQIENRSVEDEATSTNKGVQETSNDEIKTTTDEVEYTDLKSKWKKENEDAAKKAMTEQPSSNDNQGIRSVNTEAIKNESFDLHASRNVNYRNNEDNKNNVVETVSSDEEDVDRRPNRDLDKIEY